MVERVVTVKLGAQISGYVAGMEKMKRATKEATDDATQRLAAQREAMQQLGGDGIKIGIALAAGLALSAKAAIDWQSAWTGVTKTVDGTPEQLAAIEDGLRGLAKELPATHAEIAGVAEAAGQLGIKADSVVQFTKVMIDLSETTNLTADEAATSIAQLMNVMQTSPKDVDRLGASLVALGNDGASTEKDIVLMAQRIAGAGKIIGLTEGEVLGFANALASAGVGVEEGGSAISRVMTDIAKAVSAGGEEVEGFARVAGVSSQDFAKSFNEDPAAAIVSFVEGLGKVNAAGGDVFTTLSDLGQSDVRVSRALLGMANSGDLLRDSLTLGNEAWKDNSALLTEAEKRYATVEAQLQMTQGAINDAAISFGQTLLPAISDAASGVADFAGFIADLPEPLLAIAAGLTALTTGVALFGGGLLLLGPRIVQTKAALIELDLTGKNLAKTIGKGGLWMAAIAVATSAVSGLGNVGALTSADIAKLDGALAGVTSNNKDLNELFSGMQNTSNATNGLSEAANKLTSSGLEGFIYQINKQTWGALDGVLGWIPAVKDMDNGITKNEASFKQLGSTLGTLAKNDLPGATEQFSSMLEMMGGGEENAKKLVQVLGDDYEAALVSVISAAGGATTEQDILNFSMGKGETYAKVMAEATERSGESLDDLAGKSNDTQGAIKALADEIANFGRTELDASAANRDFEQSIDDATAKVEEQRAAYLEANGTLVGFVASLDVGTQSGRDNGAALDAIAASANANAAAILNNTGSVDQSTAALGRGKDALYAQLAQFGITGAAADVYVAKLLATPEDIATQAKLNGIEEATAQYEAWIASLSGRTLSVIVRAQLPDLNGDVSGSGRPGLADGGPVPGFGGPREDNIPIWASSGEHMFDAEDVRRMGGHAGVYRFRASLYEARGMADGGEVGYAPAKHYGTQLPSWSGVGPSASRVENHYHVTVPAVVNADPEVTATVIGRQLGRFGK